LRRAEVWDVSFEAMLQTVVEEAVRKVLDERDQKPDPPARPTDENPWLYPEEFAEKYGIGISTFWYNRKKGMYEELEISERRSKYRLKA
jgi:hypothetical protein